MRGESPLIYDPRSDFCMIFDYAGVKRTLSDHETFSSDLAASANQPTPPWFIFFDPPRRTRLRGLIMRAFTPATVSRLEPRIRELARTLLDRALRPDGMDFAADFAIPLPMMVISELIGIGSDEWLRFREWSDVILTLSYTVSGREPGAAAGVAYGSVTTEMAQHLERWIEERQSRPREDLLTDLIRAEIDGETLSHAEILAFVQLLLVAGNETTTNLLNNAVLCLAEYPDQLTRLQQSPELLPAAIEEVLRYRSPVQFVFRGTARNFEMHGREVPAGKRVLVMIGSANRDESHFAEPDRFDIERQPNPHLAFGHGLHFCVGAPLSRLEARIALSEFLSRVRTFVLAPEPWQPRHALHVHGPERLPIRFTDSGHR
jgi:cytochrome P450